MNLRNNEIVQFNWRTIKHVKCKDYMVHKCNNCCLYIYCYYENGYGVGCKLKQCFFGVCFRTHFIEV